MDPLRFCGIFKMDDSLMGTWTKYIEESDEKYFRKFVKGLVTSWERSVSPNWDMLVTSRMEGHREEGPALHALPEELLPALSKFLFIGKDEAEQSAINAKSIGHSKDIVKCLIIICRLPDNIPLVSSMDFVQMITQMDSLLLQQLLDMESSFFARKVKTEASQQKLRDEILDFIVQSCHFLETIYDPHFRYRTFLCGKEPESEIQIPPTPIALHQETIPFLYESFETALADCFPDLAQEMLTVFGAIISGARHNAIRAISPATTKMISKTIRDSDTNEQVHITAIYCSAKSIRILHEVPMEERQLDIQLLIEQYQQILSSVSLKSTVSVATLVEGVGMLSRMMNVKKPAELKELLAKNALIQTLLEVIKDSQLDTDKKKILLPVVIDRLGLLLKNCEPACQKMIKIDGYSKLFEIVNSLGPPDSNILKSILAISTHGEDPNGQLNLIRNIEPITYLLKWISETDYENLEQQVWLTESLNTLCGANIQNKMLCCQSGVIRQLVKVLSKFDRLHEKSAIEILKLIESLGTHSIEPVELKHLIALLDQRHDEQDDKFPYKSHVIHVISSMAKSDGYEVCREYFEIGNEIKGLSVPNICQWPGPVSGMTFHCWIRLEKTPVFDKEFRRQLYSFYTTNGNGFEAFFSSEGILVAAVAHKKEFLAVPLEGFPLNDERWHCIEICHAHGKGPFGKSTVTFYVDGAKRLECPLKFPALSEPISYCTIGSPLQRGNIPALNSDQLGKTTFKEGLMDAIKIGIPGVINLPSTLKGFSNDPHLKWTLIGLENQFWGLPISLVGQMGMICCFQDALTHSQIRHLYSLGPNNGLTFAQDENPEIVDVLNRIVFFYSAKASHNMSCPNLVNPTKFEAQVFAQSFGTRDVKDVINCIGGVHVLFPLLENAALADENEPADTSYLSLRDEDCPESRRGSVHQTGEVSDWELVPSSSFSDWKLEQNAISGFLTLVKNLVTNHTINKEQLMRCGGVAIIGALLQDAKAHLIDVNVLMATQLLVELAHASQDQKLLFQIFQHILFDFRIWSKSEFHVQIGHIQYLSTIIKDDRKLFRKKFGVQFLLDVVRKHYGDSDALSVEDCKTIRASLFGLIKYFLQREVTSKEVYPLVSFILAEKNGQLLLEICEMLTLYLENRQAKDQMFLVMYESRRADLFHCLLLNPNLKRPQRMALQRMLTAILRTNRVSVRHKHRMHLFEARYLGFLHLRFKQVAEENPVSKEEILVYIDQMLLFDDATTFQGILGLVHHLQLFDLDIKVEIARRLMTFMFTRPDVPMQFARQIGWQDCLTRLLVKKILKPDSESNISLDDSSSLGDDSYVIMGGMTSPSHYIDRATTTAKHYLPVHAGEAVGALGSAVGDVASKVVSSTSKKVSSNVNYAKDFASEKVTNTMLMTQGMVSQKMASAQERVTSTMNKTHQFLGDLSERASFSRKRLGSVSSIGTNDESLMHENRSMTPQYMSTYNFEMDDLVPKSTSTSSEDVRDTASSSPTRMHDCISEEVHDMEMINEELINELHRMGMKKTEDVGHDQEEELCQLAINILFTVMWRGLHGASEAVIKERGQVIACINMLGLNNELFRSHVDLKRRLVEMCIQAVLSDVRDKSQVNADCTAMAEHVMQWAYDLVVLDPYGKFDKKVSESLLDGILAIVESFMVFQEGNSETEWSVMAKMALDILLKCADESGDIELCTMATAKLHALVQTRASSSVEENGYLILQVSKIIEKVLQQEVQPVEDNQDHYSFIIPVMKALLEKSRDQLHLTTNLPSMNLRQPSPTFFEAFKTYSQGEEWRYFLQKKVTPFHDAFLSGFLSGLPLKMDTFWAEGYELSKIASHKRNREIGESKLRFETKYLEPFHRSVRNENVRFNNMLSQEKSHFVFIRKRWKITKRLFFGPRGAWYDDREGSLDFWKLANNENFMRMRMKLIPNLNFNPHREASAARDNVKIEEKKPKIGAFQLNISKEAVRSIEATPDDSLTEEELKSIAIEQMETTNETTDVEKQSERLVFSEECELVTYMSVIKGTFELTTNFVYFFDASPFKENEDRFDFRWSLMQLREMHLRRFNLRRSAIEFFLLDQTNYFLNFPNKKNRNRVYSKLASMKLPHLVTSSSRSPADLLKSSNLTQKWVNREISNFEYLMQLNTIAGRSFNDLSQYPVFPWILADYESEKLDLHNPKTFRDLSKPIGIQNEKHVEEVRSRFQSFDDPAGVIAKFHYGTHYSNSAMVLHYLVRVEPFTSLHIELQSGRFDVADRQFHSVAQTWKSLFENLNDVKELIPEFFYFPEFLQNLNNFDLGRLQGKKNRVHDVVLPAWAKTPDDFIRKHRLALESEYVSAHLHEWIDLIFGCKQKGEAAEKALNVFYYCSYEGAVDLDAISDPGEREAIEGMINNFGQTPCQLLKDPHPQRLLLPEYNKQRELAKPGSFKVDMFLMPHIWKPYFIEVSTERDPLILAQVPKSQYKSFIQYGTPDTLVTLSEQCVLGSHGWLPYDRTGASIFSFDKDLTYTKSRKQLPLPMTPNLQPSPKLFAISPDAKYIFFGGQWDNSLQVFSIPKVKVVSKVIRHIDVITCVAMDSTGNYIMTGSRDNTSIIWEAYQYSILTQPGTLVPNPKPLQVLSGHDKSVTCVAISTELDMAVSGSEDGSVNVYTVKEGQYVRSIFPPTYGADPYKIDQLNLSYQGHVVFTGHNRDVHSLHVYTVNGHLLTSSSVEHRITAIGVTADFVVTGDENGELILRDLLTPKMLHKINLQLPIQHVSFVAGNTHILVPLRDGKLIVIGLKPSGK